MKYTKRKRNIINQDLYISILSVKDNRNHQIENTGRSDGIYTGNDALLKTIPVKAAAKYQQA
jgi:hypothetical protein